MFPPRRRGGGGGISMPIMLLLMQMMNIGFSVIPPVTLVLILGQLAIFLEPGKLGIPPIHNACISAVNIWYGQEYKRLLFASFLHASDFHLYYNMVSFLWKGITLERKLGSKYFAYMIVVFAAATEVVTIGLALAADEVLHDSSYLRQCAVGFSGVLFALKVVTTHMMPAGVQYLLGFIPVHSRFACWAELVLIQILVPNASFIGHLAGILVGLAYVKGPLKSVMNVFIPTGPRYTYQQGTTGYRPHTPGYTYASGTSGSRQGQQFSNNGNAYSNWGSGTTQTNYERYTGGLSEEEQIAQALHNSQTQNYGFGDRQTPTAPPMDQAPPPYTPPEGRLYPDLSGMDDLRQRRLNHYEPRIH